MRQSAHLVFRSRAVLVSWFASAVLNVANATDSKTVLDGDWFAQKVTCEDPLGKLVPVPLASESDSVLLRFEKGRPLVLLYSKSQGISMSMTLRRLPNEKERPAPLDLTKPQPLGGLFPEHEEPLGGTWDQVAVVLRFGGPNARDLKNTTYKFSLGSWILWAFGVVGNPIGFLPGAIPTLVVVTNWELSDGPNSKCFLHFQRKSDYDQYLKSPKEDVLEPWVQPLPPPDVKWTPCCAR